MPEVPDGGKRTRGDYIPAHLPAMNPDKALAGWMGRRGLTVAGGGRGLTHAIVKGESAAHTGGSHIIIIIKSQKIVSEYENPH